MLFLLFDLGEGRYAIDTAQVVEVLPRVRSKEIPQAPPGVAGAFNYHGSPIPLIDLTELALGQVSRARMSTRIILVNYAEPGGETHLLGLLAEHIIETSRREPSDFVDAGVTTDGAPYLGPIATDVRGMIQWIEINALLPAKVRDLLFRQPIEAS